MTKKRVVFELYVPLSDNAGRAIPPSRLRALKKILLERFGGFTHFPQRGEGQWKVSGHTFRDRIVILRVIADGGRATTAWFVTLKKSLIESYRQSEFLITRAEIDAL